MKQISYRPHWLGLLLAAVGLVSGAQQNRGAIAGEVTDSQGKALPGVAVALSKAGDNPAIGAVLTSADGRYRFISLEYGEYRISLKKDGYQESVSDPIELKSESLEVNFTLRPLSPTSESPQGPFAASGLDGATAPSGYSAGASADDSALVMARLRGLQESDLSLLPAGARVPDCDRENDLVASARTHPQSFGSNHDLGVFYVEHGEVGKGLAYLRQASVVDPLDATNARWLALAYARTDQVPKAIALIRDLAGKRPLDADLALMLARLYNVAGDRPNAIAHYLLAANLDSGERHLFACGIGLLSLGSPEKASPLFLQAVARHPDSGRLWMGLGIAQDLADNKSEAVRSLMRAADEDPDYLPTYLFLAALSGAGKERDTQIIKRLEVLVVSHPESAEAHYDYALAFWRNRRLDPTARLNTQIEEQLKLAIAKDPEFSPAHLKLGTMYQEAGDLAGAAKELKRAVQLNPGDATAHYRLAQVYRRMNQAALAELELAQFKKIRHAPLQEDDIAQGLLLYAPAFSRLMPLGPACHPAR
jgi:tetratricopeptide (TPR) repeat protein